MLTGVHAEYKLKLLLDSSVRRNGHYELWDFEPGDHSCVFRELINLSFCWCVIVFISFSRFIACARELKSSK
jgi:hypothetical protein